VLAKVLAGGVKTAKAPKRTKAKTPRKKPRKNRKLQARKKRRAARRTATHKRPPKRSWLKRNRLSLALAAVGMLVGFGAAGLFGYRWFVDRPWQAEETVAVSWPDGLNAHDAAQLLADMGLTDSPSAMSLVLRATSAPDCFVAGPHLLPKSASPRQLVAALCRNESRPKVKVSIPEGFHRFAIAKRFEQRGVVAAAAFLHASADRELLYGLGIEPAEKPEGDTAEGFLFPATYKVHIDSDPRVLVKLLVDETQRRWDRLIAEHSAGWERLQAERRFERRHVITLASMVEKEAAVAEERPIIASVFLNRLADPEYRRLQSDPTAMYGCYAMGDRIPSCKDFNGRASGAINRDKSNVFSTYAHDDLPPGPISNPGDDSVRAVLAPADTEYRFFVAKGGGKHEFTENYDAHLAAVKRLRELRAQ
jgi:UPF0755 protein